MRIAGTLRLMGYLLLVVVAEPLWRPYHRGVHPPLEWILAFAVLCLAFHVGASAAEGARARRLGALACMTPAVLAMAAILPCQFTSLLLVVVASQAALVLSPRQTAAFVAVFTTLLGFTLVRANGLDEGLGQIVFLLAAESFAAVAVHLARREAEALRELAHANAELRATRSLLEETSRVNERTRIARELHDVLGHDLTALGLQLEVATHVEPARAGTHVVKAQEVTARLLRNVRDVVTTMRESPGPDLGSALRTLVESVPGLCVHLDMPAEFQLDDGARGQCILRCVQEIVTNALKHSRASNLWITIAQADGAITLDARDDGQGAAEVRDGCGLSGMRARLEEMGGWLRVGAEPRPRVPFGPSAGLPAGPQGAFEVTAWLPAKGAAS